MLSLLAQLVGLVRISIVAGSFGTSPQYDAFNLVTNLSTFVFGFIASGVTVLLIPAFMQAKDRRVLDTIQTALYGVIILGALLLWLARLPLLAAMSFGRTDALSTAVQLAGLVIVGQALVAVVGITTAYFQCRDRFSLPKFLNLISVVVLFFLILTDRHLSIERYALYLALTNGLNAAAQLIWGIRTGYRFRPRFSWGEPEVRTRMRMFAPIALSTGVYQATIIIDTVISSSLGPGRVALLSYMTSISGIMNAVVSSNLVSIVYPKMSADVISSVHTARGNLAKTGLILSSVVAGFVAIFMAAGKIGIEALFQHGEFHASNTETVFLGSLLLLAITPLDVVRDTMYRFFYASSLTVAPLMNSLLASGINVFLSMLLARFLDIYGVVLGTSLAAIFSLLTIRHRLIKRFGIAQRSGDTFVLVPEILKLIAAIVISVSLGVLVNLAVDLPKWGMVVLVGTVSAVSYFGALILQGSYAWRQMRGLARTPG